MSSFMPRLPPSYNNLEISQSETKIEYKKESFKIKKPSNSSINIILTLIIILVLLFGYLYFIKNSK